MAKRYFLSKSKLNAYRQCAKRLWLEVHRKDLVEISPATQRKFDVGHQVGELARAEHPDGVLIGHDTALSEALKQTQAVLAASPRRPVFEATVRHADVLVRADLLVPTRGGFHMAEVKSSAEVKPYHLIDVAVQAWVLRGAGVPVRSVEVRHIDSGFVYPGGGDYRGLFASGDVEADVARLEPEVPKWVRDAQAILNRPEPDVPVGAHCDDPFECPFKCHCASLAGPAPAYPVTLLPGAKGKRLAEELLAEGFADLRDVPAERIGADEKLRRIHAVTASGKAYLSPAAREVLAGWGAPRRYLDFETIGFTVPRWAGTRPFQQVPFQWSCHAEDAGGGLTHAEFLDLSGEDPSRACAESLLVALGASGPVVAYSAAFESGVIKRLAERHPDLAPPLEAIGARIVDLLPVVREHYYHRDMKGSFSIKDVLPTVAPELAHSNLGEVQEGGGAQGAYLEATEPGTTAARRAELERSLREYCERDTLGMVRVARALDGQATG
jgi:hypothetical protein